MQILLHAESQSITNVRFVCPAYGVHACMAVNGLTGVPVVSQTIPTLETLSLLGLLKVGMI